MQGLVAQLAAGGAKIKSVQFGATGGGTTAGGYVDVTINSVAVDKTIVIPLAQYDAASEPPAYWVRAVELINSTTVRVYGAYFTIAFIVVEFEGAVIVQRGTASMSSSVDSINVTISSVDTAKSFAIATGYASNSSTSVYAGRHMVYGRLTAASTLQIAKVIGGSTRTGLTCPWQVITVG